MNNNNNIPDLSHLPLNKCHFNFVGEGAANLVFEVIIDPGVKLDGTLKAIFQDNLLRVPKTGAKIHPHQELQRYWELIIAPLFDSENLVQQRLVKLGGSAVISRLNSALDEETETRRHDFKHARVADAEYGMLVEDMRAKPPTTTTSSFSLEFKPKWLAQSPNAPPGAIRCRTCAREALRIHTTKKGKCKNKPPPCCPLDFILVNSNSDTTTTTISPFASTAADNIHNSINYNKTWLPTEAEKSHSLTSILTSLSLLPTSSPPPSASSSSSSSSANSSSSSSSSNPNTPLSIISSTIANWLTSNTLLPSLLRAQVLNDTTGPLNPQSDPQNLSLAMTLRDCSVFLRISCAVHDPAAAATNKSERVLKVEAKLADLDKKDYARKIDYWKKMESELISGGFYQGMESPRQRTDCVLERLLSSASS